MIRRMLVSASFSGAGALMSRGAIFAGLLFTAYKLGPVEFGQFSLIQNTALLFTTFCALSLGQMAIKIVSEAASAKGNRLENAISVSYGSAVIISLIFSLFIIIFSPTIARHVSGSFDFTYIYILSAGLILSGYISAVQNGIALAIGKAKEVAIANLIAAPFVVAAIILGSITGRLSYAFVGYLIAQLINMGCQEWIMWRYRKENNLRIRFRGVGKKEWSVLWRLGLPSSLAGLMTVPVMWFSLVLLARSEGGGSELGHFAFANQARAILLFGVGVIANSMLAHLSAATDKQTEQKIVKQSIKLILLLVMAISGAIMLVAKMVLPKFAPEYLGAIQPLEWLLLSVLATGPTAVLMRKVTANEKPSALMSANAAFSVVLLMATFLALKMNGGATGVAVAYVVASLAQFLTIFVHERMLYKIQSGS